MALREMTRADGQVASADQWTVHVNPDDLADLRVEAEAGWNPNYTRSGCGDSVLGFKIVSDPSLRYGQVRLQRVVEA